MRISDWSADVCSSDLAERGTRHARRRDRALPDPAGLPGPHRARTHGVAQGVSAPRPAAEGGFGIGDWGFEGAFRSRRSRRQALLTPQSRIPNPQSRHPFSWPTRVYWEDTDAGGVVYHAQYLAFLERARTAWLRAIGYGQALLRVDHGLGFAVRALRVDVPAPARLDAALDVSVALRPRPPASLVFALDLRKVGSAVFQ